jgi:ribose 1,5-bisphosphate isomerase
MFASKTIKVLKEIVDLKVQGASNVSFACQDAFLFELQNYKGAKEKLLPYFYELGKAFWKTRPTEPGMKHFIVHFYSELERFSKGRQLNLIKNKMTRFIKIYEINQKEAINKIAKFALKIPITHKAVIFTHCHSSIVENAIKELHQMGRVEFVVNSETRPLLQGRITAQKLALAGIKVHHVVDSGVYSYAKLLQNQGKTILFFTGSDVITKDGELVNKIGTSQISLALNCLEIKHYVFTTASKIDPVEKHWKLTDVEMRNPKEIWDIKNKNIIIENFAFDITPSHLIHEIITENGLSKTKTLVKQNLLPKREKELWIEFEKLAGRNI